MNPPRIDLRPGVHDPVVLMISRCQVEEAHLESVIQGLRPFTATREDAWLYRCQMTLVITGYDDDPREIIDIPEARLFLKHLARDWPYWAFFFNHVDGSLVLLLSCAAGKRFPGRGAVEIDIETLKKVLLHGFAGTNELFDRFGFDEKENEAITRGVAEVVQGAGLG